MVRAKQPHRSILITDATAAAGCGPGYYRMGEARVELGADGRVRAPDVPGLAGSALAMPAAVANTVRFTGLPLGEVLPMASTLPARYLGVEPAARVSADWDEESAALTIDDVSLWPD
jgi:N-acetylglucosamine-6-phosphate deacetylase